MCVHWFGKHSDMCGRALKANLSFKPEMHQTNIKGLMTAMLGPKTCTLNTPQKHKCSAPAKEEITLLGCDGFCGQ